MNPGVLPRTSPGLSARPGRAWIAPVALAVALFALPWVASAYVQDLVGKIALYAVMALSLELLVGMTGLVSLGHAAFAGIGAYATVLAAGQTDASIAGILGLAVGAGAGYALFVGALSLRTKGVYFIMVTLAFSQMAYFVIHDTPLAGGSDGIFLSALPAWGRLDLQDRVTVYRVIIGALVATYAGLAVLRRSRFGHALAGIRMNEQRMRASGYSTYAYQLAAFVIAGAIAAAAGFLLAVKDGAVNPELLSWHESGALLLMLILGGIGSLRGAVVGAVAFTLLKEAFRYEPLLGAWAGHWQLTLGLTIIAFVALMPQGIVGLRRRRSEPPGG